MVNVYNSRTKTGKGVQPPLWGGLAQHSRDSDLLVSFKEYLGCGSVNKHTSEHAVVFIVTKLSDITEKIIPFFDKYKIVGVKYQDYQYFKKLAELMENGAHLTHEGLQKICKIKSEMNRGRNSI